MTQDDEVSQPCHQDARTNNKLIQLNNMQLLFKNQTMKESHETFSGEDFRYRKHVAKKNGREHEAWN